MPLVSLMLAPGTTAPLASTTLPLNCPVPPWAKALERQQKMMNRKVRVNRADLNIIFLLQVLTNAADHEKQRTFVFLLSCKSTKAPTIHFRISAFFDSFGETYSSRRCGSATT